MYLALALLHRGSKVVERWMSEVLAARSRASKASGAHGKAPKNAQPPLTIKKNGFHTRPATVGPLLATTPHRGPRQGAYLARAHASSHAHDELRLKVCVCGLVVRVERARGEEPADLAVNVGWDIRETP